MEFKDTSYEGHTKHFGITNDEDLQKWTRTDTVDYWRHKRMYDTLLPLLKNYKNDKWLTVGDGRYGVDAHYLQQYSDKVIASDITGERLKIAKEKGYVNEYKVENAERMTFEDNSFDFILCKETYHHFPRPAIAVYEMLRVAKKAIVFIEPNDENIITPQTQSFNSAFFWLKQACKNLIKKLLKKQAYYHQGNYEEVGNYVFSISEREIEKIALGLNYEMVAFKGMNDYYIQGVEYEAAENGNALFEKIKKEIKQADNLVRKGGRKFGLLTAIIFKDMPNENCIKDMREMGYTITTLMRNPYL